MSEQLPRGERLKGKTAIVTGAGAEGDEIGIGRAIALLLAAEGARLACCDLAADRAEVTAEMIRASGGEAIGIACDVAQKSDCAQAVAMCLDRFGTVDILINNVGLSQGCRLEDVSEESWDRIFAVNLKGAMFMSQACLAPMVKAGGGSIVNIGSVAGMRAHGSLTYGTSKAAMAQLAREITSQYGRQGIRANTVSPGHVMTPHAMKAIPADMREKRRRISPLGIEGDAWDIARAVLFLASDDARFITAVELAVDGGVTQIGPMLGAALLEQE